MRVFVAWRSDHEGVCGLAVRSRESVAWWSDSECLWHGSQIMRVFVAWRSDHENVCGLVVRSPGSVAWWSDYEDDAACLSDHEEVVA